MRRSLGFVRPPRGNPAARLGGGAQRKVDLKVDLRRPAIPPLFPDELKPIADRESSREGRKHQSRNAGHLLIPRHRLRRPALPHQSLGDHHPMSSGQTKRKTLDKNASSSTGKRQGKEEASGGGGDRKREREGRDSEGGRSAEKKGRL